MQALATTQRLLTWLFICPFSKTTSTPKKIVYFLFTAIVCVANLCNFAANLAFTWKFISIDLEGALFSFMGGCCGISNVYIMIIAFKLRHKINNIFKKLNLIYRNRKCEIALKF